MNPLLPRVAYFCMEYGLSEELPIYAGGLGILAGDYVKSAGDLKMPLTAIGIFWSEGYTVQQLRDIGRIAAVVNAAAQVLAAG